MIYEERIYDADSSLNARLHADCDCNNCSMLSSQFNCHKRELSGGVFHSCECTIFPKFKHRYHEFIIPSGSLFQSTKLCCAGIRCRKDDEWRRNKVRFWIRL